MSRNMLKTCVFTAMFVFSALTTHLCLTQMKTQEKPPGKPGIVVENPPAASIIIPSVELPGCFLYRVTETRVHCDNTIESVMTEFEKVAP